MLRHRIIGAVGAMLALAAPAAASAQTATGYTLMNGRYSPLDAVDGLPTAHVGFNDRGQITGSFLDDGATLRGFVRDARGGYTPFDAAPGALTLPFDINDRGTVVGS